MNGYYITFRSVTPAQRGEGILRRKGIRCILQRTPAWMEKQGCGYCLKLQTAKIGAVAGLLREYQVEFRKIYRQNGDGSVEEVGL